MTELLTAQQMRNIEQTAIDTGDVTGPELMERAGQGVVDAMLAQWPEMTKKAQKALVFCGPGNNGGDGFVIARLLDAMGWPVRVFFFGEAAKLPPSARTNYDLWMADHPVFPLTLDNVQQGKRPDVIIDAVFGIGLSRPLPAQVDQTLDIGAAKYWRAGHKIRRVAVDCPSGLDLDRGRLPRTDDAAVIAGNDVDPWPKTVNSADLTVTFHAPKLGHYLGIGPTVCGTLVVMDIGLWGYDGERAIIGLPPDIERVRLSEPHFMGRALPLRMWPGTHIGKQHGAGHKFSFGHAIVFAGGVGRGGAARLAARGALRAGAGLVTVLCPPAALIENACQLNAIMLRAFPKTAALGDVVDGRASAFCLGPGMGIGERTRARVIETLARGPSTADHRQPAVVLDADALTSFEEIPQALFDQTHARTILTPHAGEFERLFPDIAQAARTTLSKVDAVRQAAERAGCIVLLKGQDTVIAAPDGGAALHGAVYARTAPWLATAGAGDVLAGLIAGLAASPTSPDLFSVAEIAVWLHVEAARAFGPGLIAEDLPEQLPALFRELGL